MDETCGTFKAEKWEKFILEQNDEQEDGYFLEVDLEYPEELHDKHNAFHLAPGKLEIEEGYLGDHQKHLGGKWGII